MTRKSKTLQLPKKLEKAVHAIIDTLQGIVPKGMEVVLRYLVLYGGRGSAKSHSVARILINVSVHIRVRILCTRETQKSIEESVYTLLCDVIHELGYDDLFDIGKKTITCIKTGSEFIFAGLRSQDMNKLKSTERIAICWVEEAHVVSAKSLDILTPTVRDDNSIIIFTLNPELETDPVYERYIETERANVMKIKMNWRDNPWFNAVLEEERQHLKRTDKSHGQAKYKWVWEGKCLPAVEGAIFADEVAKLYEDSRVRPLDYDSKGKVFGIMDLGWGVMSMVLAQRFASTVQIIGYREWTHTTYEQMTRELEKLPWRWGGIFMPHDASHRDPKYGKSHFDVMRELGWKVKQIPQIGVENYVAAGRDMFGNLYVSDAEDCKRLLHCLRRWRRQIPTTTEHPGAPMKDEYSHGAEAFCYTAVIAEKMINEPLVKNPYAGFEGGTYAA